MTLCSFTHTLHFLRHISFVRASSFLGASRPLTSYQLAPMKRSVVLFPLFLLLSIAQAGRRRKTDTQTCILRDGYCRSKCNETTWAIPERDLGTCANGKQRCCRPEELLPSHQEISDGPQL